MPGRNATNVPFGCPLQVEQPARPQRPEGQPGRYSPSPCRGVVHGCPTTRRMNTITTSEVMIITRAATSDPPQARVMLMTGAIPYSPPARQVSLDMMTPVTTVFNVGTGAWKKVILNLLMMLVRGTTATNSTLCKNTCDQIKTS